MFDKKKDTTQKGGIFFMVETNGLAFLRKSHGGYKCPPDTCQEPPFESIAIARKKEDTQIGIFLFWWRLMDSNHRPPACEAGALTS